MWFLIFLLNPFPYIFCLFCNIVKFRNFQNVRISSKCLNDEKALFVVFESFTVTALLLMSIFLKKGGFGLSIASLFYLHSLMRANGKTISWFFQAAVCWVLFSQEEYKEGISVLNFLKNLIFLVGRSSVKSILCLVC